MTDREEMLSGLLILAKELQLLLFAAEGASEALEREDSAKAADQLSRGTDHVMEAMAGNAWTRQLLQRWVAPADPKTE